MSQVASFDVKPVSGVHEITPALEQRLKKECAELRAAGVVVKAAAVLPNGSIRYDIEFETVDTGSFQIRSKLAKLGYRVDQSLSYDGARLNFHTSKERS